MKAALANAEGVCKRTATLPPCCAGAACDKVSSVRLSAMAACSDAIGAGLCEGAKLTPWPAKCSVAVMSK